MTLPLLHRRLMGLMALAALGALAAGADLTPWMAVVAAVLIAQVVRGPDMPLAALLERASKLVAVGLFGWVLYVGLVAGGDVLPPSIALLYLLLVGEVLRPVEAENDFRLYSLSFALVIAATAYYPGVGFAVAFTAYVALATLSLMVGHLRRQSERYRVGDVRIGRSFLAMTAALSVITLLASVIVFVAFPRLPRTWFGQGRTPGGSFVGFGDEVSIGDYGTRLQSNPDVMFRVEFEGGRPAGTSEMYWRGLAYDHFDGTRWARGEAGGGASERRRRRLPPPFVYHNRWRTGVVEYRIFGGPPGVRVLFGRHPVLGVWPRSAIRPRYRPNGDIEYEGWDAPVYSMRSAAALPSAERLRAAPDGPDPGDDYLQLPPLDPRVFRLADSLTRGEPTRLDRVLAVERWLQEEFRYTLDLPRSAREASLEHFLFVRRAGHCEYFSSALAVLLRAAGIPARNVNGFLGGEWNDRGGYLAVTGNNAHSWVEVWFPDLGWVPFDATPAADREEMLVSAGSSPVWPMLFWLDALQFRWHRWVIAYDLGTQMGMLRSLGERFGGGPPEVGRPGPVDWRGAVPWLAALGSAVLVIGLLRRRRPSRPSAGTRAYLALRRAYARAGYDPGGGEPPLAFLSALRESRAPAVDDAEWIVARYLRARFAGDGLDREEREEIRNRLRGVRRALRG